MLYDAKTFRALLIDFLELIPPCLLHVFLPLLIRYRRVVQCDMLHSETDQNSEYSDHKTYKICSLLFLYLSTGPSQSGSKVTGTSASKKLRAMSVAPDSTLASHLKEFLWRQHYWNNDQILFNISVCLSQISCTAVVTLISIFKGNKMYLINNVSYFWLNTSTMKST